MSLRSKIALVVALVVLGYALGDHLIQRAIVLPRFEALERDEARKEATRVERALLAEVDALDARCSEWATWTETCAFLAGCRDRAETGSRERIQRFEAANLGLESFQRSRIDLLYVVDRDGTVHWGKVRDLDGGGELQLKELAFSKLSINHPYLREPDQAPDELPRPIRGLTLTDLGPMFLASRPITCTNEGDWSGTLILGRLLSEPVLAALSARTESRFSVLRLDQALPPAEAALFDQVTSSAVPIVEERDDDRLEAYVTIDDLRMRPALLVRTEIERSISRSGADAARYALVSTVAAGFLLLGVLLAFLRRTVVDPLSALTRQAVEIGRTDDTSRRLALTRPDEIGVLSREFDRMLGELETSRAQLVDSARTAGMSEIATGILHNVGNVLNSVNVSAGMVAQRVQGSKLPKLERLLEMVEAQGEDLARFLETHPKGKHVVPFLGEVTRTLRGDHDEIEREVRSLGTGIEHIRRLVEAQQELAGKSELRELVDVAAQVELAWGIVGRSSGGRAGPELVREIEDLGRVRLDRHKLVQVLVNLFKNACEAIEESGRDRGRVWVRVRRDGDQRLSIEVADDGVGIAPANLTRVFRHGFTTKPNGHGFGLHSCANAATEMGGDIRAASPGPGRGASFVLRLPLETPAEARGA
jgi:signal transduction histidine kinase